MFREQGQQSTCPDVNLTLKRCMVGQIQVFRLSDGSMQFWGGDFLMFFFIVNHN